MNDDAFALIDVSNLAFRNFFAIRQIDNPKGAYTQQCGMFFRDIAKLRERLYTKRFVFAFDSPSCDRRATYPDYKQNRGQKDSFEDMEARKGVHRLLDDLRTSILPQMGFKNLFQQDGKEADDIIASLCSTLPGEIVIVSTDKDLYQCLNGQRVVIWNVSKDHSITEWLFRAEYGIAPSDWPLAKAMAGDVSDNVKGIPKVGIKTAAKFIRGELSPKYKTAEAITHNPDIVERNIELVTLPFPGTKRFEYVEDNVTSTHWNDTIEALGLTAVLRTTRSVFY